MNSNKKYCNLFLFKQKSNPRSFKYEISDLQRNLQSSVRVILQKLTLLQSFFFKLIKRNYILGIPNVTSLLFLNYFAE